MPDSISANKIVKEGNEIKTRAEGLLWVGWVKQHVTNKMPFELRSK